MEMERKELEEELLSLEVEGQNRREEYEISGKFDSRGGAEAIEARILAAFETLLNKQFMPGEYECLVCGFSLHQRTISAETGAVGVRKEQLPQICPNGCAMLDRVTWEKGFKDTTAFLDGRLKDVLGDEHPWPLESVLETLKAATHHLLWVHDCDDDGHELYKTAADRAGELLSAIRCEPPRNDVRQWLANDCQIACIAAMTGDPWATVMARHLRAYSPSCGDHNFGRPVKTIATMEAAMEQRPDHDWTGLRTREEWAKILREKKFRAIISVPSVNVEGKRHAVYWDGKVLCDPSPKKRYPRTLDGLPMRFITLFKEDYEQVQGPLDETSVEG